MKNVLHAIGLAFLAVTSVCRAAGTVSVTVNAASPQWQISPYLIGLHQAYGNTPDAVFADGSIAAWAKRVGVATSRFPGGTEVQTWDWQNPSGQLVWGPNSIPADPWNPAYSTANNIDPSQWMSFDEFLSFATAAGISPIFGVNSLSGQRYNRQTDGINRAVAEVAYAKQKGFGGGIWYIGNEESQFYPGGIAGYAKVFALYARAMKAVDPAIKVFWNDNSATTTPTGSIATFLANDGGTADGLETHGKFPYGGSPTPTPAATSIALWQAEVPLVDEQNGNRVWRNAANTYRTFAAQLGRPNLLIANNEYGMGKTVGLGDFTRYPKGLAEAEFLMELTIGNWYSACMWETTENTDKDAGLLQPNFNYRLDPVNFALNLFADGSKGQYVAVTTSNPSVHGFASLKQGLVILYLLNKTASDQALTIQLQGTSQPSAFGRMMQDTTDHFGQLVDLTVNGQGSTFTVTLPTMTLGEFIFGNPGPFLQPQSVTLQGGMLDIRWNSIPGASFQMESSIDLVNWTSVGATILPDNLWTDTLVTAPAGPKTFYHFRVLNAH